jgi:hypothetical protein
MYESPYVFVFARNAEVGVDRVFYDLFFENLLSYSQEPGRVDDEFIGNDTFSRSEKFERRKARVTTSYPLVSDLHEQAVVVDKVDDLVTRLFHFTDNQYSELDLLSCKVLKRVALYEGIGCINLREPICDDFFLTHCVLLASIGLTCIWYIFNNDKNGNVKYIYIDYYPKFI